MRLVTLLLLAAFLCGCPQQEQEQNKPSEPPKPVKKEITPGIGCPYKQFAALTGIGKLYHIEKETEDGVTTVTGTNRNGIDVIEIRYQKSDDMQYVSILTSSSWDLWLTSLTVLFPTDDELLYPTKLFEITKKLQRSQGQAQILKLKRGNRTSKVVFKYEKGYEYETMSMTVTPE